MYKSIKIKNFRCLENIEIDDLSKINLIAGDNNVGKSSLLEALFLFGGFYNPQLSIRLPGFRGFQRIQYIFDISKETPWDPLFYNFETDRVIEFSGKEDTGEQRSIRYNIVRDPDELKKYPQFTAHSTEDRDGMSIEDISNRASQLLKLDYDENGSSGEHIMSINPQGITISPASPPPPQPTYILPSRQIIGHDEVAERFGKMEKYGFQDVLLESLKVVEPRLIRLHVVIEGGIPNIHGDVGLSRSIPLGLMGGGIVQLATYITAIGVAKGGIVLIDEFENGLYHEKLPQVWKAIHNAAVEFDTQVFATTHSMECIQSAHRYFSQIDEYPFKLHRLQWVMNKVQAISLDQDELEAAIKTNMEVR